MDVDAFDGNEDENELTSRRNRIQLYKSLLNYFKGKSLSLDTILASKQPNFNVLPTVKTHKELTRSIQGLYDDITLIQSVRNSLKLISHSLTCTDIMKVNETNFRSDKLNKIEGIIYFSGAIIKMYANDKFNDIYLLEKMRSYSTVLNKYMKSLDNLKEREKQNDKHPKEMEKLESQVYKINLMRSMKSVLIGYISLNCPSLLRTVQPFRSSLRRDLTIDDFQDTWNVGLPS